MSARKILWSILIIALLCLAGFYRDFVFKSINNLLQAWDNDMSYSMAAHLSFLEEFEYDSLVRLKWLLTLLFSLCFLLITMLAIHVLFTNRYYLRIAIFSYLALVILSALITFTGFLIEGLADEAYELARYLMGIAQSPLVLMILVPCFLLADKKGLNR
jgi:hypothetical protein